MCFYGFVCQGDQRERVTDRARKGLLAALAATKLDRDAFVRPAAKILSHSFDTFQLTDTFPPPGAGSWHLSLALWLSVSESLSVSQPKQGTVPETTGWVRNGVCSRTKACLCLLESPGEC